MRDECGHCNGLRLPRMSWVSCGLAAYLVLAGAGCTDGLDPSDGVDPDDPLDPTEELFDPDHVLMVELGVDPDDWDEIRYQHRNILEMFTGECQQGPAESPYTYVEATATLDGEVFDAIGIRKKGLLGSDNVAKPSLKLNLDWVDGDSSYLGKDMLTLNNANQDPSYLDQCLGYGLFTGAGVPAPRCSFAHVTVNGEELGLYVHVESIRRDLWPHHFDDASGNHYEGTLSDFRDGWLDTFQAKDGNSDDRSDLQAVVDALAAPDDQLLTELGAVVDLDEFYSYWAIEVLTGHWDGYASATNNFHVYHDPSTDQFAFVPWGIDALFDGQRPFGETVPESVVARTAVPRRLYGLDEGRAAYQERLLELMDTVWDDEVIDAEIDRMAELVTPYLLARELDGFDAGVEVIRAYVPEREQRIRDELDAGAPLWEEPLSGEPCMVDVGGATGTFDTTWGSIDDSSPAGPATISLDWHGDDIPIPEAWGMIGEDEQSEGEAVLAVVGVLAQDTYLYPMFLMRTDDVVAGAELSVDWQQVRAYAFYIEGDYAAILGYIGDGTLTFDEAGTEIGASVTGNFDVRIFGGEGE